MEQKILSISQINEYLGALIDRDPLLGKVAVCGEISNYKVYPSGHHYFTLKDENAALRCVMFRSSAVKLRFRPANGMKVIAMGRIAVYPRDGGYQLYCSAMPPEGIGDLYAAFEQLKVKLASQGLFEQAHKQPLPKYPGTIGIITSSAGAAIHDMLRILKKRYPLTQVRLLPVRVQGAEAPGEIAAAIRYANMYSLADLLIVGRGGGSIEDLWAFNDETVAHAIYDSRIPVISAVGHEPDVTISDFVADLRAATPSNAAELAVPDQEALRQQLDSISSAMATALQRQLKSARQHLQILSARPVLQSPQVYLDQRRNTLLTAQKHLILAHQNYLGGRRQHFIALTAKMDALSPLKVLTRGYAMVQKADREVVRSAAQVDPGERITIRISDGRLNAVVDKIEEVSHEREE